VAQCVEELYYSATAPAKGGKRWSLNKIPVTVGGTTSTTAKSLAESLQRRGCQVHDTRHQPERVTFNFYAHPAGQPGEVSGTKLYREMQRPADR
jgi:hypothetical protein